ncbi:diguanylate cyclase [Dehalobacter sp. DCM]|uniref:GGDEF domain-containing response regulator n=1 Tax=Dehalobacter sp. DCM TaxID=2907827 RepID=UPI003081E6BA|nr:diguanylate cyclase [Dehalobacter sp. DCM]
MFTILAIDDQEFNLAFMKEILSDYIFLKAKSGKEALHVLSESKPDLILLDVLMPDMDGYDLIRILKADNSTRDIPVIFITGCDSEAEEEKGLTLGAVDYITKPFRPSIIQARVKNTLKLIHQQRLLEKMARIDGLTEIPNRRYFQEKLDYEFHSAVQNNHFLSLIMIDVDKFKKFNDYCGHAKGDEALAIIAKTMQSCLSQPHEFLARYGGEEFVVLLPQTNKTEGLHIAECLRVQVYNTQLTYGPLDAKAFLTVSLGGYSLLPKKDQQPHFLLEKADACLYQAKNTGRNRVIWDSQPSLKQV